MKPVGAFAVSELLIAALLLGGAGCASQQRGFPIGMWNLQDAGPVSRLSEAGFTSVQTYTQSPSRLREIAESARAHSMTVLAHPTAYLGRSSSVTSRWPIEAWYLYDEPDVHGLPPLELRALAAQVRAWDPDRAQAFAVGQGTGTADFGDVGDVVLLDWYPVPHLPIDSVADEIDKARKHLPRGKPLWMIVQAMNWKAYAQRDPTRPRIGRFPTYEELRFMSYLAILHSAEGLYYFELNAYSGGLILDRPKLWKRLSQVVGEISQLRPFFENGNPARLPRRLAGISARSWKLGNRQLWVLVNRKETALPLPHDLSAEGWRLKFGEGKPHQTISPLEVIVLER